MSNYQEYRIVSCVYIQITDLSFFTDKLYHMFNEKYHSFNKLKKWEHYQIILEGCIILVSKTGSAYEERKP